jgi:hypothetical protein
MGRPTLVAGHHPGSNPLRSDYLPPHVDAAHLPGGALSTRDEGLRARPPPKPSPSAPHGVLLDGQGQQCAVIVLGDFNGSPTPPQTRASRQNGGGCGSTGTEDAVDGVFPRLTERWGSASVYESRPATSHSVIARRLIMNPWGALLPPLTIARRQSRTSSPRWLRMPRQRAGMGKRR